MTCMAARIIDGKRMRWSNKFIKRGICVNDGSPVAGSSSMNKRLLVAFVGSRIVQCRCLNSVTLIEEEARGFHKPDAPPTARSCEAHCDHCTKDYKREKKEKSQKGHPFKLCQECFYDG